MEPVDAMAISPRSIGDRQPPAAGSIGEIDLVPLLVPSQNRE
jgi:hypothetical protein